MTQGSVPLASLRHVLARVVQRSSPLAFGLSCMAAGACGSGDDAGESTSVVSESLATSDCGFTVKARVLGVCRKGFGATVSVTNVSGETSKDFAVLVDVGTARIIHVAGGTAEAVEGGYLLRPKRSLKHRRLDPGETYKFHLSLRGRYTELTAHMMSNNAVMCDQTAPSVALTASDDFFAADGTLTLSAEATDDVAIHKVVFLQDDEVIGSDTTAPYTLDVPVTSALNGRHTYEATAYDLTGNAASQTARVLIAIGNKFFGTAVSSTADYEQLLDHFDQLTPANAGKWGSVESTRDQMDWTELDAAHQFAKDNNLPFKLHTLIWGQQQPGWLSGLSAEEQLAEIDQWMAAVAERYPDLTLIDVVNEPMHAVPAYSAALGGAGTTGYDWVIKAFEMARSYFPDAELILNEYNTVILDSMTTQFLEIVTLLQNRGLVDGIGEQAHFLEKADPAVVDANLARLIATGLPVYVSELDLDIANDALQAKVMSQLFPVFWEASSVLGVTHWGYRQGGMWRPDAYLLRSDGTARPAFTWLECYLAGGTDCPLPEYVAPQREGSTTSIVLEGEDYDAAQGVIAAGNVVAYTDDGDWISYQKVVFDTNWDTLTVAYARDGQSAASITVHLGSLDNAPAATVALPSTGGWGTIGKATIPWAPIGGERDVFIRFNGGYGVANVDSLTFGAPAGYGPNLMTDSDFEAAGTGGWWSWGTGIIATTAARAKSGAQSLAMTGRPGNSPLVKSLTSLVIPGRTYRASLWANLGGTASAAAHVTNKIQCKGADAQYTWLGGWTDGSKTLSDGTWTEFSGDISIPDCELQEVIMYLEGPGANVDLYIDHVSVRAAAAANIVQNGSFESGTAGWYSWNNGVVAATTARAHGGSKSLLVTNRASNAPAATNLTSYVTPGSSYPVSLWVSIDSTDGSSQAINVTRKAVCDGSPSYVWLGQVTVPDDGGWVEIAGTLNVPNCNLSELVLWVEGGAGADLYVDDVKVMNASMLNLIPDGTFETGQGAWYGWSNASLSVIDGYAHSGTHSLVSANRTQNGALARDVTSLVTAGKRYQATFWLSVTDIAAGSGNPNVTAAVDCGSGKSYNWLGAATINNGQWGTVSGIVDLSACTTVSRVELYAEGTTTGNLYIDDVMLVPVP